MTGIQLHTYGLHLFRSPKTHVWTIIGRVVHPAISTPFTVGVYSGPKQPKDASVLLEDLMRDLIEVQRQAIKVNGVQDGKLVELMAVICDHPARAFVECNKPHTDYFTRDKCTQQGVCYELKVTYPSVNLTLLTNT
ncbi:hypothetical protein FGIG_02527 [Fasciola gigantica]|uniref:Uncharacterized protein n=1 Tax=Fasciola gigantica TaxID=46835 RepID=A0A504YS42_FASGI|nr:hypothetical protein FGIG_02527 [Fasciola gigantica]